MADPPPLPPLPPAIGLDLGTAYSRAALLQDGQLKTIKDERGNPNFPTCVGFSSDPDSSVVLVGKEARDLSALHPTNTAVGFKRLIGCAISDPRVAKDEKYLPVEVVADEKSQLCMVRVRCKGKPTNYSPDQLMTTFTERIVENAFTNLGIPIRDAVVTVPSCFNLYQRQLVHQLCEEAGLNVLTTVNEATAAGLAYCFEKQFSAAKGRNILVVNLGAGYLSVVVMAVSGSLYEVKSIAGSCDVSGCKIDHILVDHYLKELKAKVGHEIPRDKRFVRTLRLAAAAAKRKLSTAKQANITFQQYKCEVGISRALLEELCANLYKNLMDTIDSALRNCNGGKLGLSHVDDVLLVGDGTTIPKVRELIQHFFSGKELKQLDSESASHGSALLAAALQNRTYQIPSISNMILMSVLPSSLSIEAPAGLVTTVVPKNSKLPARETVKVTTIKDRQQKVIVNFYEGESPVTKDNLYLGQVALTIPLAPRGMPKISVTIEVQWDGSVVAMVSEDASWTKAELAINLETLKSTPVREGDTGVVACDEAKHNDASLVSIKEGDNPYYFLPPDAVMVNPPLVPKRVTRSYENVMLKENGTTETTNGPPLPPKKGYENVELKEKGTNGTTSLGHNPPVPLKRVRVPLPSFLKKQEVCAITPPSPRRVMDDVPERSKLCKTVSASYSPVLPTSPEVLKKGRSDSSLPVPLKESDNLIAVDNPNPYYSLPPDSDYPLPDFSEDELSKFQNNEEETEVYLTLDENFLAIDKVNKASGQMSFKSCPPLPPKDAVTVASPSSTSQPGNMAEKKQDHTGATMSASLKSEGLIQHLKERLLETEIRMKVFEQQVAERDEEIETLRKLLSNAEQKLNEERTRAETAERERTTFKEHAKQAERRAEEVKTELQDVQKRVQSDSFLSDQELKNFNQSQFWVLKEEEIKFTEEEIGRGGWGIVLVAHFRGLRCAAKRMHRLIISDYNRHLFVREMSIAARVRHPNLVQFIGATVENEPVILMELMICSLRSILEKRPLNPTQIHSIALDTARAINYLHLMRPDPVIHRDISSANVLLNPTQNNQWMAKLSDYGSANFVRRVLTVGPGNPTYAAPEAGDPSKQGPKMDIYSYGVLLLEMCTRKFPDPTSADNAELLRKIQGKSDLAPTIKQCLEVYPEGRPSMDEVIVYLSA